jgi:DivIVA domain-containing protein
MSRPDLPRTQTNPQDVRRKNFTVRLRGLDPDEVRYFMAGLANDLEGLQAQVATLTLENDSLRAERSEPPADAMDQVTDQAVSVLNEAQRLAGPLIDEAMQTARDLLLTARSQQRGIMEQARWPQTAPSAAPQRSPSLPAARSPAQLAERRRKAWAA